MSHSGVALPATKGTNVRYQSGTVWPSASQLTQHVCDGLNPVNLPWVSTLVALDTLLTFAVTGTRIASIEAKAAGAKGRAVRLIPSENRTQGHQR